jgi:hypothetical protein
VISIGVILLLAGCGQRPFDEAIESGDRLMASNPDHALRSYVWARERMEAHNRANPRRTMDLSPVDGRIGRAREANRRVAAAELQAAEKVASTNPRNAHLALLAARRFASADLGDDAAIRARADAMMKTAEILPQRASSAMDSLTLELNGWLFGDHDLEAMTDLAHLGRFTGDAAEPAAWDRWRQKAADGPIPAMTKLEEVLLEWRDADVPSSAEAAVALERLHTFRRSFEAWFEQATSRKEALRNNGLLARLLTDYTPLKTSVRGVEDLAWWLAGWWALKWSTDGAVSRYSRRAGTSDRAHASATASGSAPPAPTREASPAPTPRHTGAVSHVPVDRSSAGPESRGAYDDPFAGLERR